MNEQRSCLISFLGYFPIGKEITAFNHSGEKQPRQDYSLWDEPPSRQEHLDCLLVHQILLNIRLILTSSGCSAYLLIFSTVQLQFQQSTSVLKQAHSTRKQTCSRSHPDTEFRWAFPLRYLPQFDCHFSTEREPADQPAWRIPPGDVPCFLNVKLVQEAERHGGWLVVASHWWSSPWVLCLPTAN